MQINLVKDFSFFDINKLEGFTKEVGKILSKNPFMSNERINKIIFEINFYSRLFTQLVPIKI